MKMMRTQDYWEMANELGTRVASSAMMEDVSRFGSGDRLVELFQHYLGMAEAQRMLADKEGVIVLDRESNVYRAIVKEGPDG